MNEHLVIRAGAQSAAKEADDAVFGPGWRTVLSELEAMYRLLRQRDIEVALLIFPHTFQLFAGSERKKRSNPCIAANAFRIMRLESA